MNRRDFLKLSTVTIGTVMLGASQPVQPEPEPEHWAERMGRGMMDGYAAGIRPALRLVITINGKEVPWDTVRDFDGNVVAIRAG